MICSEHGLSSLGREQWLAIAAGHGLHEQCRIEPGAEFCGSLSGLERLIEGGLECGERLRIDSRRYGKCVVVGLIGGFHLHLCCQSGGDEMNIVINKSHCQGLFCD